MNYFSYLKKRFPFYIISGVIFGLAVFALTITHKYNQHASNVLGDMYKVSINKYKVKKQVKELDAGVQYFRQHYKTEVESVNPGNAIFRALDRLEKDLPEATIKVSELKKTGKGTELPVDIEAKMKSYNMIVDYVDYIESFSIPDYEIRHIAISKGQEAKVVLDINGVFLMPPLEGGA